MLSLSYAYVKKMGGRLVGLSQTGKGVKGKLGHLSTQRENGLVTQMIKVCVFLPPAA